MKTKKETALLILFYIILFAVTIVIVNDPKKSKQYD
jgi:hypothetical protein